MREWEFSDFPFRIVLDFKWKVPCSVELFYHSILQDENIFCKVNKSVISYNEKEKGYNLVLNINLSIEMIECCWKNIKKSEFNELNKKK
jgi:hypothetical protein